MGRRDGPLTKDEVARAFPEAVAFARELRAVFGDGVRLLGAINYKTGAAIGTLQPSAGRAEAPAAVSHSTESANRAPA